MSVSADRHGSNQADIRQRNRGLALASVAQRHSLTRAALARSMGLTRPAVSRIVTDLVTAGLLTESPPRPGAGRGRPTSYLSLPVDRHVFFAVDVRLEGMLIQGRDLAGTLLTESREALAWDVDAVTTADLIATEIRATADRLGRWPDGIGLAVGALLDPSNELVVSSVYRSWRSVPLSRLIADRLGPNPPPVLMSGVANCAALANWQELAEGQDVLNLLHLQIGIGSGSGFVQRRDGVPYVAPPNNIAHIPLLANGPRCACGARGCFDAMAGFRTLVARAADTGIVPVPGPQMLETYCDRLRHLAADGHPEAVSAIEEMADWFAQAAAILINILQPSRFTYGGYPLLLGQRFTDRFVARTRDHVTDIDSMLATTSLGDGASVMGAYWLAVGPIMTDPELSDRYMTGSDGERAHRADRIRAAAAD